MEEPHAPDYSHLPTDALLVVFAALFSPVSPSSYFAQEGLPLSTFIARWHAVGRVCKTWREALLAHPPPLYLEISTLPEDWIPWLATLPVRVLRIEEGLDARWSSLPNEEDEGQRGGPPGGMPGPLPSLQLVAGLEGAGRPAPFWSLAPFSGLQSLHLQAPVSSPMEPAVFDSAAVRDLQLLQQLSLGRFADFQLEHLPSSLRRLRLAYDGQTRTLSMACLPDHITNLDLLQLEKPGALGLCIDDCWSRVAQLDVRCRELLIGVPVQDRQLIATFERPYREGNFVPPHIWGDEEADDNSKQAAEMTANHFLATLPCCSSRLERLRLEGAAAASTKFMPVLPHGRASLQWLWSVVRLQGLHNLYGLSGHEMQARQQLFGDRLSFRYVPEHRPQACAIQIVRGRLHPGPEPAEP
ncbi:hypothetical protein CHLNCDRAFT_58449 [Chlorella variabilis]|uniref:F-box domain-containing protein n=1 Tax=Chlorella variabilis TaxID=554065 RepID=E1ZKC4_CHLVA|nr:hypothetical protein CHLNCDRAFT_58449 [Chlorella variabilis]EFN53783.1 hypothetical protein CHLNCDRAFT_58449 [Chlorella variabilis]|eukprot:XP_005845885.1 hypothetical protein CHLNCDRAFT_58449 [Chlorella variabilis]